MHSDTYPNVNFMNILNNELLIFFRYESLEAEYNGSSEEMQIILAKLTLERDQLEVTSQAAKVRVICT